MNAWHLLLRSHCSLLNNHVLGVQRDAGLGKDYNKTPLSRFECPACFEANLIGQGCTAKCDLNKCDLSNGVCSGTTITGVARRWCSSCHVQHTQLANSSEPCLPLTSGS